MKKILLFFVFTFFYSYGILNAAQRQGQARIDSLLSILSKAKEDTNKVILFNELSFSYRNINANEGIKYANDALVLSEKLDWQLGIAHSYNALGGRNRAIGNYKMAKEYLLKSLTIYQKLGSKPNIAAVTQNLGNVYSDISDFPKALEFYFMSLKMNEELQRKEGIAMCFVNIGGLYIQNNDFEKALSYLFKALQLDRELGIKDAIGLDLGNIGGLYFELKDYEKAMQYFIEALKIDEELGNTDLIQSHWGNIGVIYQQKKDFKKALEYYFRSLKLAEQIGDKNNIANQFGNIGSTYLEIAKLFNQNRTDSLSDFQYLNKEIAIKRAKENISNAISLHVSIGDFHSLPELYNYMTELHQLSGNYKEALGNYKRFISIKDSIYSQENKDKIASLSKQREEDLKQKEIEIQKLQLEAARKERWYFIIGIFVLAVFTWFTFNRFKQSQKQKNIIELKSIETEKQKAVIEEKQKEIMDSIHYASYIQQAVITSETYIGAHLPDFFVVYYPKDIVAGDFYWAYNAITNNGDEEFFLVTADCTGHGVPGAFMSLMGINFLNEIVVEQQINSPAEILNRLRKQIIQVFAQNKDGRSDGMDMNIYKLNKRDNILTYAAANNPLWLMRNGELTEQSFQKMPVGAHHGTIVPFTENTINLQKGDIIYTYTDGYADQFGGTNGKKFKYKQLEDILIVNCKSPMSEQKNILETAFNNWKGNLEQVDDVCLIGVKI